MGTRKEFAAKLLDLLPKSWRVIDSPQGVGTLSARSKAVLLVRATIRPAPETAQRLRLEEFEVWVAVPQVANEDALDDALDIILRIIDGQPWISWSTAERSVLDDAYPAWKINATIPATY